MRNRALDVTGLFSGPGRFQLRGRVTALLTLVLLLAGPVSTLGAAPDFRDLASKYLEAKSKLKKTPFKSRASVIEKEVEPRLQAIAETQTDQALQFITREFTSGGPDIAGAAVKPLLSIEQEEALKVLLGGFSRQPTDLREEILTAMAKSKRDLEPAVPHLLVALRTEKIPAVRAAIPKVLGKVDTLVVARGLIDSLAKSRGKPADMENFAASVRSALADTKNEEVKEWLAREALGRARGAQLPVLIYLAGRLKLSGARSEVIEYLDHPREEVASQALIALQRLGIGDQMEKVASRLLGKNSKSIAFKIEALDALASSGEDEAVEVVCQAAREGDLETRAVAIGSLARASKHPSALPAVLSGLEAPEVEIRNAALRALSSFRDKRMIEPLIARIEKEKEEKLRIDSLKLLIRLTGKNMGLVSADWNNWWGLARQSFTFPEPKKGGTSVEAYDLDYFGIEISSNRLAFLIDASSSMTQMVNVKKREKKPEKEGEEEEKGRTRRVPPKEGSGGGKELKPGKARKLDVLKHEMVRVLRSLPASTHINILTFHATFQAWKKNLQPMAGRGRQQAIQFIENLNNGRGTNVYDTLEAALKDRRVDTIFLLTDGMPSRGKYTDMETILREVQVLNRVRGATINCIAFGEKSELLEKLAEQNGGVYRFVDEY